MAFEFLFGRAVLKFVADDRELRAAIRRVDSQTKRSVTQVGRGLAQTTRGINTAAAQGTRAIAGVSTKLQSQLGGRVQQLGLAFGFMGSRLAALGTLGGGVGVAIAVGLGVALGAFTSVIKAAAGFEAAFAEVRTLIDESKVAVDDIKAALLDLPAILGGAEELTKALYQAISAGAEPAAAIGLVGTAAKLAVAGLTSTFAAVDILTTVINAYGFAASEAARVSDVLFKTVELGKTTVDALATSLGVVIPFAAQLGISIEDLTAAVATLTKGGLQTRIAITALRGTFTNFIQEADKFRDVGIDIFKVISEEGLAGAFRRLREVTGGNIEALRELVPDVRALAAVLALSGVQFEEFIRIQALVADSAGATETAFEKQANTFRVRLKEFGATFERLKIAIGASFIEPLTSAIKSLTNFVKRVQFAKQELNKFLDTEAAKTFGKVLSTALDRPFGPFDLLRKAAKLLFGEIKSGAEEATDAVAKQTKAVEELEGRQTSLAERRKKLEQDSINLFKARRDEEKKPSPLEQSLRKLAKEQSILTLRQIDIEEQEVKASLVTERIKLDAVRKSNVRRLEAEVARIREVKKLNEGSIEDQKNLLEELIVAEKKLNAARQVFLSEGLKGEQKAAAEATALVTKQEKERASLIKASRKRLNIAIIRGAEGAQLKLLEFERAQVSDAEFQAEKRAELDRKLFDERTRLAKQALDIRIASGMAGLEAELQFNRMIAQSAEATADQVIAATQRAAQIEDQIRNRKRNAAIKLIELAQKRATEEGRGDIKLADVLAEGALRQKEAVANSIKALDGLEVGVKGAAQSAIEALRGLTEAEGIQAFKEQLGGFEGIIAGAFQAPDIDASSVFNEYENVIIKIENRVIEFGGRFTAELERINTRAAAIIERKLGSIGVRALEQEGMRK